jgi:hypothetical protein
MDFIKVMKTSPVFYSFLVLSLIDSLQQYVLKHAQSLYPACGPVLGILHFVLLKRLSVSEASFGSFIT